MMKGCYHAYVLLRTTPNTPRTLVKGKVLMDNEADMLPICYW